MVKPLRELNDIKKYKGSNKLDWTKKGRIAFEFCQQAVSNCQEIFFSEDTATPILQNDASDYLIGGYMYMITSRLDSSAREKLNWLPIELVYKRKKCYGIY